MDWIEDPADLSALVPEWADLAERTGADVYLTPAWVQCWLRHFGQGRDFACLAAHEDGRLVGLLPFVIDRVGLTRVARLAGTDPHSLIFRLPLEPASARTVMAAALKGLLVEKRATAISFTPVSEQASIGELLHTVTDNLTLYDAPFGHHVVFELPGDFKTFMAGISKKRRAQYRRDTKGLYETYGMVPDNNPANAEAFAEFVSFHNAQWNAVGKGGHFSDWPGSTAFYSDLAEQSCHPVHLYQLTGTQGALATQFTLEAGNTCHWRLPARSLDADAEKLSIGKVGLLSMIEALISRGVTRIEAGMGAYGYKLSYGGQNVTASRMIVTRSGAWAQWQLGALLGWAALWDILYYRIWFKKLAPRLRRLLGVPPRPLWRIWIRSRI